MLQILLEDNSFRGELVPSSGCPINQKEISVKKKQEEKKRRGVELDARKFGVHYIPKRASSADAAKRRQPAAKVMPKILMTFHFVAMLAIMV
ncbi:unnamed protein product [Haemonchus placei]|uniref:60S ribosomal protein L7a n=1 Tax=Haemonchus placei TaxID=6290 RepID=A0A0N4W789_HAEPC|nr:unnamed protein product [Haemonchus placei]